MSTLLLANFLTFASVNALETETYNPQTKAMFPTSATLISGVQRAIQFDAEFTIPDGKKVLEMIQKSGKNLELIVITCGDPDYYFGLQAIVEVASRKVVNHIKETKDEKLKTYAPKLKGAAPTKLYVPEIINTTRLSIDSQPICLKSAEDYAAYYYIADQKLIFGGVGVSWNIHVFTADTQTPPSRAAWRKVLKKMIAKKPRRVIPGHYLGTPPEGDEAIKFTLEYLEYYEKVLEKNHYMNSKAVIAAMKERYPHLGLESSLELGAKVNTGEMKFSR